MFASPSMIPSKVIQSSWHWTPKGILSYCGPFSIVSENEVIHHLKLCSFENWVGTDQHRHAQLNENMLTLSTAPTLLLGKTSIGRLTWKRVTTFI